MSVSRGDSCCSGFPFRLVSRRSHARIHFYDSVQFVSCPGMWQYLLSSAPASDATCSAVDLPVLPQLVPNFFLVCSMRYKGFRCKRCFCNVLYLRLLVQSEAVRVSPQVNGLTEWRQYPVLVLRQDICAKSLCRIQISLRKQSLNNTEIDFVVATILNSVIINILLSSLCRSYKLARIVRRVYSCA